MRTAGWYAGVLLLTACATTHPAPGGPSFESDEVLFVAPSGWELLEPTAPASGTSPLVAYLANQPLRGECGPVEASCTGPLADPLRPGGVLVTWAARLCAAQLCNLPSAPLVAIGNRQGVEVSSDAGCEGTGFTERVAYYVTVTPQRVDILLVCARDPSEATRSAFRGFLDAIRWRIP